MAILNLEWLLSGPPSLSHSLPATTTALFSSSIPRILPNPLSRRFVVIYSVRPASSSLLEESESSSDIRFVGFHKQPPTFVSNLDSSDGSVKELAESPLTDALAFEFYQKARLRAGFRPDKRTLRILIRYLLKSKDWNSIWALANDFKYLGVFPEKSTCVRLIGACVRARKFRIAESLLGAFEMHHRGLAVAAFGAALRGYNKLHMYNSTILVHDRMVRGRVPLDAVCYCSVMDAHRKLGNPDRVLGLFHELESSKLDLSPATLSRLYLILCDSLGRSGRAFDALRFFRELQEKGVSPDYSLYASLICAFAGIKEAEIAGDLYLEAKEKGLVKDPSIFLKLVLLYVEVGLVGRTLEVVKEMKESGFVVSDCVLCAVVNGHVKNGGLRASVRAYEELIVLGCIPGQVTYASMINIYCRLGISAKAQTLFDKMLQRGFDKCVVAYANMVSMYGKSGRIRDAMRLLAKMKEKGCEPNAWVYNSLIDMHGRALNLRQAEKLWKEMKRKNIHPDKVSYTSIIGAYSKAREFKECIQYYREFQLNGGKIDRAMVGMMVGVFSKTSMINELIKLLQDSKSEGIQLDERLYMSALNALRDVGLETQVRWFKESFAYAKIKYEFGEGQSMRSKKLKKNSIG